jgi:hypothetical protein
MAIPSSGPLSLTTIQTEFGGSNPIGLSEYYAGGGLVPAGTTGTYGAVPSSGTISIQNFYGTSNVYAINNSLRFRRSVSAHLSRTSSFSGTTNTISFWIKRGELGTRQVIFGWSDNSSNALYFQFDTSNRLELYNLTSGSNNLSLITTQVFRDPSAWYHFVVVLNTTQATASNRAQFYVNGSQITAFDAATYPAQNTSLQLGNSRLWNIGREGNTGNNPGDYYLAEWNFIDGQALTPSSFGETNATTGSWYPKAYTGTYGTNGFELNFSNIALTSGSNTGLGQDFSGNGNYWNTNNISVTAGITYDAMLDSPTPASATVGNYCVMNAVQIGGTNLTNANLQIGLSSGNINFGTLYATSGKIYFETVITTQQTQRQIVGIANELEVTTSGLTGVTANSWGIVVQSNASNGQTYNNGVFSGSYTTYTTGDIVMVAFDVDNKRIWFGKNGTWLNSSNPSAGTGSFYTLTGTSFVPAITNTITGGVSLGANFGQRPFAYTPPTGFVRLNTFNLPTSTAVQGSSYMVATLYTGNGGTQTITNASGLRPDLVWFKERSSNSSNWLFDTIRGIYNRLSSNETTAEGSQTNSLTAFNANGFSVGSDVAGNESGQTYVAWQWIANASTVTNTSGTISSQVRVNTTSGFSIVTWTGTGVNATVGHGLGVAPKVVISRKRNGLSDWAFWITGFTGTQFLEMNTTGAILTGAQVWNSTTPTSTVFSVGTATQTNNSGGTYVAYLWSEIAGFSNFGRYTGNGSADGTFVYTGFRPKFIMLKRTDISGDGFTILDTSRSSANVSKAKIEANSNVAENTTYNVMDILSNGFKLRDADRSWNANGGTYIYMAFAENPFKNANAR